MSDLHVLPSARRPIPAGLVVALYREAGWWPERSVERTEEVLATGLAVGAWRGDSLVGFARAVSDGVFRAFIEDVVVASDHRGRGIARSMVRVLLDELGDIDTVTTFSDGELLSLYEATGFTSTGQVVLHRRASRS